MCGRFTLRHSRSDLAAWLEHCRIRVDLPQMRPRFNVAPSQIVCTLQSSPDGREWSAENRRWGLLPAWADDLKSGFTMINARSETASTKPAYRGAFRKRRCLVLADGFLEWIAEGKLRQPVWFTLPDQTPFFIAGLWEPPPPKLTAAVDSGQIPPAGTVTLLTTSANESVTPVHDRMPVILPAAAWQTWLTSTDPEAANSVLLPYPGRLGALRVNRMVNSAANDSPECLEPAPSLFPDAE